MKSGNQQKTATIKAITYNIEHINRGIKIWLFINCQGFLHRPTIKKLIILKKKQPELSNSIDTVIKAIKLRPKKSLDLIK